MSTSARTIERVRPTGAQYALRAGDYQAVVVEVGGGLRELTYRGRHLVHGYDEYDLVRGGRGQLLAPWPNRIDGGTYEFAGESRQLDLSEPANGNAIHGLTRWDSWRPHEGRRPSDGRVDLRHRLHPHPGYPHALDLVVTYQLDSESGLTVTIEARNVGATPAPYGVGMHPYLSAGTDNADAYVLTSPARTRIPTDERGIPVGRELTSGTPHDFHVGRTIGAQKLDDPYTDLERDSDGLAWIRLIHPSSDCGVELWMDAAWDYLQIYTGDKLVPTPRVAVAVEPMSCPPNAFRSGEALITLAPGNTVEHAFGIMAID